MTKILVLYYSMYGHIEIMAKAVAEGARSAGGTEVVIKRVPDSMAPEVAGNMGPNWIRRPRLHRLTNCLNTMPSFSAPPLVLVTWPDRCETSSTGRETCGLKGRSSEKSGVFSPAPALAAGMSQLFSLSFPPCFTKA